MKKVFLLFTGLLFWYGNAQQLGIKMQESKVFKQAAARVQNDYILPTGDGGFITIATKRSGFLANPLVFESYATLYNNNLEQIISKTFRLNKGIVKGAIKGAFVKNGELFMVEMDVNNRKKHITFKRIKANITDKSMDEKVFFKIDNIYSKNDVNLYVNPGSLFDEKMKYYSDVNFYNPKVYIKFSENNNFFTIVYRDFQEEKTRYFVNTFNDKFEKLYTKTIVNNTHSKTFYINDLVVDDNNGQVYIVAKVYKNNPHIRIRNSSSSNISHFMLYNVGENGSKKLKISPKVTIEDFTLLLDKKQLGMLGFYRNKYLSFNDIDGIARININPMIFSVSSQSYKSFREKLVSVKFRSSKRRSKNHRMIIRKKFLLDNGDIIINSEDFFIPNVLKKNNRELTLREYVGDMFTIKISQSGNILWSKKIYKLQMVKPRLALHSFFSTVIEGQNYLLFTDSKVKKQEKDVSFYLRDKDLQNLNGVRIYAHGGVQKGVVKEHTRTKFRMMPIEGIMISKNEAIIPAKDHHLIRFYKLTF
jgi:hypothetical protein